MLISLKPAFLFFNSPEHTKQHFLLNTAMIKAKLALT